MALVFERAVTEGLGDLSYLIGDDAAHVAAAIDPRADVDVYVELAHRHQLRRLSRGGMTAWDDAAGEIPRDRCVVVYCDSGYRASIGASLLQRVGFARVADLPGSMRAWKRAGLPLEKG